MAEVVYAICAATALTCAVLLQRGYGKSGVRLLLWGAACFWLLAANNVLLFVDLVIIDGGADLREIRAVVAAAAPLVFLTGLIWDEQR